MNDLKSNPPLIPDPARHEPSDDSLWAIIARNPSAVAILGAVAIFLLTLLTYSKAMQGDFIWDDDYYVTNNRTLRTLDGLQRIWSEPGATTQYYPMVHTTFWIEYQIWKLNPIGYHLVNVLLHACGAVLLWTLLRRLAVPGAWAAAAIFALHPVHVESVAWITERKNVLSGVFYFAAMMVYLRYCNLTPIKIDKKKEWFSLPDDPTRLYALAVLLFACALLSKSVTATLPAAVLLLIWWKRGRITWDDITPLLPFFAMGIAMGAFTASLESKVIGASGQAWDLSPTFAGEIAARCIVAGRAIWFYAGKLLLPYPLIFNYARWKISAGQPWQYLFPFAAIGALGALWALRTRIGRGPLTAALFFAGTLFPALGFVNVFPMRYSFVADHFQYLPSIGLIVLIVALVKIGCDRLVRDDVLNPAAAPAAVVVLLAVLGMMSWRQSLVYHDLVTLWKDTLVKTNQRSWLAANNYGTLLLSAGKLEEAEGWFRKALRIKPDHAEARYNLGRIAEARSRSAEAAGKIEQRQKQLELALDFYRDSLQKQPGYKPAEARVVEVLARLGRMDEAISAATYLANRSPNDADAQLKLGMLLADQGRFDEAIRRYQQAIELAPEAAQAHFNLGAVLVRVKMYREGLSEFARAVQLDQNNPQYISGFGTAVAYVGGIKEAEGLFRKAVELDPHFADGYYNLGLLYQSTDRLAEAVEQFKKTLEYAPQHQKAKTALQTTEEWIRDPSKRPATRPATTQANPTSKP